LTLLLDVSLEGRGVLPALVCRLVVISFGLICFLELFSAGCSESFVEG
jgi:hypothetical protein